MSQTKATQPKRADRKIIVDCDDELMSNLDALAAACERSNAWVVRRLIEAAFISVYPDYYTKAGEETATRIDVDALKASGLLGLNLFLHGEEAQPGNAR